MFLRFFQSQQIVVIMAFSVLAGGYWTLALLGMAEPLPVEGAMLYKWMISGLGQWPKVLMIGAIVLSILLGLYWNNVVERHRLINRRNYLTATFFVLLVTSNTDLKTALPLLLSLIFLLPALDRVLRFSRQGPALSPAFDTGMLLAVATWCYAPSIALLPLVFLALANLRSFAWREWAMVLLGLFIPYLFAWVWLYWTDQTAVLGQQLGLFTQLQFLPVSMPPASLTGYLAVIGWALFAGWSHYGKSISINTVRIKRSLILFLWLILLLLVAIPLFGQQVTDLFILLAIPLSIYLANYFTFTKNRWLAELLFFLLLAVNFLYQLEFHFYSG